MRKQIQIQLSVLVVVACISVTLFLLLTHSARATAISDTTNTNEIMATLTRAYELLSMPSDKLNVDQLAEVFIDDPNYLCEINAETQAKIKVQITEFIGPEAAQQFGYLTAMKSKRIFRQQEIKLLKTALEKAKSENRELTPAEWQALTEQNHGERPSLPNLEFANNKRQLVYKSLEINGDNARATYDDGVVDNIAILKRVNGRWFVAGIF